MVYSDFFRALCCYNTERVVYNLSRLAVHINNWHAFVALVIVLTAVFPNQNFGIVPCDSPAVCLCRLVCSDLLLLRRVFWDLAMSVEMGSVGEERKDSRLEISEYCHLHWELFPNKVLLPDRPYVCCALTSRMLKHS